MISKEFLTAGHAIFTISNNKGDHYTYKVSAPAKQDPTRPIWFVSLLTGPDNQHDYSYLGLLHADGVVTVTAKSKFTPGSRSHAVVKWGVAQVWTGAELPAGYAIQHEGKCGKCGRPLTCPESINSGIGPICAERVA